MKEEILNPKSGNYVSIGWAEKFGVVNRKGSYLDNDEAPASILEVVDQEDVDMTDSELLDVEKETKERVRTFFKAVSKGEEEKEDSGVSNTRPNRRTYSRTDTGGIRVR
jgi:hypothetical protein